MKIRIKFYILLVVVFSGVFSCKKKDNKFFISALDLSKSYKNTLKIDLSEVATQIDYVKLELDTLSAISRIQQPHKNVQFKNGKIYINDISKQLVCYSDDGSFLGKIGLLGKGPQEYSGADNFTLLYDKNSKQDLVAVYSAAQQKVLLYKITGQYVSDFEVDFLPNGLNSVDGKLVFNNIFGRRKESDFHALSIVDLEGDIKSKVLNKERERNLDLSIIDMNNLYKLNDTLHYWEDNYDTIWQITNKYKLLPKYVLNIGGNRMEIEDHINKNVFNFKKFSKYDRLQFLQETDRFIFFEVLFNKRKHHMYYDKKTGENSCVEFKRKFSSGKHFAYYNDIDDGIPFWPMGKVSDNKLFMITYGYEIEEYLNKNNNLKLSDNPLKNLLIELVKDSSITDNPILMIVTMKE